MGACWTDPHPSCVWQLCKSDVYIPDTSLFPIYFPACFVDVFWSETTKSLKNAKNTCEALYNKIGNVSLWCVLFFFKISCCGKIGSGKKLRFPWTAFALVSFHWKTRLSLAYDILVQHVQWKSRWGCRSRHDNHLLWNIKQCLSQSVSVCIFLVSV